MRGIGLCIKKYIAKGNINIPPKKESKKVTISEWSDLFIM